MAEQGNRRDTSSRGKPSLDSIASATLPRTRKYVAIQEELVTVLMYKDVFERFHSEAYNTLERRWTDLTRADQLPFTQLEYLDYGYTAVKARVSRVRNVKFHSRCDDQWVLHPALAVVLAMIGNVSIESPAVKTIVPVWDDALNEHVLTKEQQIAMTRALQGLEAHHDLGMVYAHAIAGDKSGHDALMRLIPRVIADVEGRPHNLSVHGPVDFEPVLASGFLLAGLSPVPFGTLLSDKELEHASWFVDANPVELDLYYRVSGHGLGS